MAESAAQVVRFSIDIVAQGRPGIGEMAADQYRPDVQLERVGVLKVVALRSGHRAVQQRHSLVLSHAENDRPFAGFAAVGAHTGCRLLEHVVLEAANHAQNETSSGMELEDADMDVVRRIGEPPAAPPFATLGEQRIASHDDDLLPDTASLPNRPKAQDRSRPEELPLAPLRPEGPVNKRAEGQRRFFVQLNHLRNLGFRLSLVRSKGADL